MHAYRHVHIKMHNYMSVPESYMAQLLCVKTQQHRTDTSKRVKLINYFNE